jgi:energy-converting hydrogenase Eha subunit F
VNTLLACGPTPLKVYDNGGVPPAAVMVTVAVPPLQAIVDCDTLLTEITAGSTTVNVPVAAGHEFASVTLYARFTPAETPVNTLLACGPTPLKVYDNGAVPPAAVMVTVAVPPLQAIVDCDTLLTEITDGSTTVNVPVAAGHELTSVTLYARFTPVDTPVKTLLACGPTPLKVYDNGGVPPAAVMVTVAVPPLQAIVDCDTLLTEITDGSTTVNVPVAAGHEFASVTL